MRTYHSSLLAVALMVVILPAYAQVPAAPQMPLIPAAPQTPTTPIPLIPAAPTTPTTPITPSTLPCTTTMLTSFTPCINYLTSSSGSGNSPTSDCCTSLRSLMTNGTSCLCQIVTGGVPFRVPINRTLAISLPKACNQAGIPIQCKASAGAPLPAPGPASFGPSASPAADISPGPSAGLIPAVETPGLAPVSETTPSLTPPAADGTGSSSGTETPSSTTTPGTSGTAGSSLNPSSAAIHSMILSPLLVLSSFAIIIVKHF